MISYKEIFVNICFGNGIQVQKSLSNVAKTLFLQNKQNNLVKAGKHCEYNLKVLRDLTVLAQPLTQL